MRKLLSILFLFIFVSCEAPKTIGYSETVPIRKLWRGSREVVLLNLNGKPCYFLLDTGAEISMLDVNVIDSFHFAIKPPTPQNILRINGFGGASFALEADSINLQSNNNFKFNTVFYITNMNGIVYPGYVDNVEVVGLLAYDFLSRYHAIINLDKSTVTFSEY